MQFKSILSLLIAIPSITAQSSSGGFFGLFGGGPDCTTVSPVADFDVDEYIAASWYIQKQQPNTYQSPDTLFCVVATYEKEGRRQWFSDAISVYNFSNEGAVNAGGRGGGGALCATTRTSDTGRLAVAPCFLPSFFGGPYWVVAYSPGSWAIVTGGQPVVEGACSADGVCTTRETFSIFDPLSFVGNNQGLWFFTREPMPDSAVIDEMEAAALDLGICTANMLDVVQEGCTYDGARIKTLD